MNERISIVIPTLNEVHYLPKLLDSIKKQTLQPYEVIVSDGFSTDGTREIAKENNCTIVDEHPPGSPAKGRNNGASKATGDFLLFLDSDVILQPDFLEKSMIEMNKKKLDLASAFIIPLSNSLFYKLGGAFTNYYFFILQKISPHAGGYCIFIKRAIHEQIKGFDQTVFLGEDHEYVERASKIGKFGFITSVKLKISIRRFREEGRIKLFGKYFFSEINTLLFKKHKKQSFYKFQFGVHKKEKNTS